MIILLALALAVPPVPIDEVEVQLQECRYMLSLPNEAALERRLAQVIRQRSLTKAEADDLQRTCVIYWRGKVDGVLMAKGVQ